MALSTKFAELFCKTNYSFLEGASHPEELVAQAVALNYKHLGIVDRNGVYGIPRAHFAVKPHNLHLVVGSELNIEGVGRAFLFAKNRNGYGNLCEMANTFHVEQKLTLSNLIEKSNDLILCVPDSPSEILKDVFRDHLYLMVSDFRDGHPPNINGDIPCVATNEPLFHSPERKTLQDVLSCIRHTLPLHKAGRKLEQNVERYLKSQEQMAELFSAFPEFLENSIRIAEQCSFSLDEIRYRYPTEWIPEGETGDSYLKKLTWNGARARYPAAIPTKVRTQLERELELISELQYSDYFLTIWDIVQFAKSKNILCQGRGSAANSCVCYVLGITAIDPVRMDLLFERFISRERKEPPDIDIDFEHERREEVIQYIYQRYGRARAAITAEVICFRRRSAMREVGKVFDIPRPIVEGFLTLTHRTNFSEIPFEKFQELAPHLSRQFLTLYLKHAHDILTFPRHLGTHVGGFVLCQEPLIRNVPIQGTAMEGRTIIQWDKNDLDNLGFVRVDILGLGILTAIRKSFELLQSAYGKTLSLATLPPEDPKVYEQIGRADTIGVFQIESRAQMNMLPRLRPKHFFDLVVEISLVRPGPIQGEMVHPYLRRRAGEEKVEYAHPELEAILKKTFGVPLFQEQVMKMAMQVAGFTGGEADELRRAMGTWRREGHNRLTRLGEKFQTGLIKKGIKKEFAERIFHQIEGFAEYGFPESHAASFAILAYATAYLKCYYPDVFVAALLNSQPMGFYSSQTLIYDALRHQVKFHPIDINHSRYENFLEAPGMVRLGFREVRGLNSKLAKAIEGARKVPFTSLLSFVEKLQETLWPTPLTRRDLFFLAGSHAFLSLGFQRREAFWEIQGLLLKEPEIFSAMDENVTLPKETAWESISLDYHAQGVSLTHHPMAFLRSEFHLRTVSSKDISKLREKQKVKVSGIVVSRQMPPTASGVLFITLEDEFGFINLVIWRNIYEQYRTPLITESFLLCEGRIQHSEHGRVIHVIVDKAEPLISRPRNLKMLSHDFH